MYTSEGIQFTHIEYIDNAAVLELIDAAPKPGKPMRGLIHILDEEAHLPKTTDGTLLAKFNAAFGAAPGKKGSGHAAYATDFRRPTLFTIAHYAGAVTYTADHFLEKSVENVALGLVSALNGSSKPLVASLFTTMSSRRSVVASGGGGGGGSRKATVGLKFSKQLAKLIATIEATQPHFIRCIKPNSNKSASEFNTQLTLEQLRYSGVFEAAKIRKSGYPFRLSHRQFAHRYACVLTPAVSARLDFSEGAMRATVQTMLQAHLPTASELLKASAALSAAAGAPAPLAVDLSEVRVGKTRTFFRARENRTLELAREAAILPRLGLLRRIGRGIIARGARRRLAAARDELAAAVDAKELVRLEAAYAAALAPQRAFYRGAPLDFPLYVPHAAEIAALIANLREEARVEPSLAELVAAPELTGATYDQLRAELAVALRLREALGRAVPSLGAAECVVGMTDGVNEHDHERLSAALAAAEKLGLASRLAKPIERARAEIARLEGGKVLEQALRAELGSHGSVYNGKGAWDHAGMSTAGLQAALDAGLAHPLESKQGVALIAEARLTLVLRPLLVAEDWAGLMCYVDGLPPAASARELTNAKAELSDQAEARAQAMRAALATGSSVRTGECKWDHSGISTAAVLDARAAIESFPRRSDAAADLLDQASAVVVVRSALLSATWADVTSWGGLASALEGVPPSQRECEEVQAAWTEFGEMRGSLEAAVQRALDGGRSTKRTGGALGWSHDEIAIEPLVVACDQLEAFARQSDAGKALSGRGRRAVRVRRALLDAKWPAPTAVRSHTAASWEALSTELEALGAAPTTTTAAAAAREHDEVGAAHAELEEARAHYEGLVNEELGKGRSVKSGEAWDHGALSVDALQEALLEASDFPVGGARQAALSLGPSARARAPSSSESRECGACVGACACALRMRGRVAARARCCAGALRGRVARARARCAGGQPHPAHRRPKASTPAHAEAILCAPGCAQRPSANTTEVISVGQLIVEMRSCLLSAEWAEPSSWGGIVDFLDALDAGMRELEECIAAKLEVSDRRKAGETVLAQCLASGKSVRVSASEWSHDALASQPLADALAAVGAFPRQSDEGLALAARASVVLPIRIALQQVQPAAVATWGALWAALEGVPSELRSEPEVAAAWEEVLEARAATEAALKAALAKGRAVRCAAGGATALKAPAEADVSMASPTADSLLGLRRRTLSRVYSTSALKVSAALEVGGDGSHTWSHAELSTTEVVAALAQLRAFPKVSDAGVALGKLADAILELRAVLAKAPWTAELATDGTARAGWAELATWLEAAAGGAFAREEEVANACQAFADKRVSVEAMARATLDRERSEAPPPAQPNAAWSHASLSVAGLQSGLAELAAFPRTSEVGKALEALLRLMITLREALLAADWESAASWAPLADALDSGVAQSLATAEPVMQIRAEFEAKCAATEAAVQACLDTGRAVPLAGGGWSHEPIAVVPLVGARKELDAFPRPSEAGRRLAALAGIAIEVREALLAASFTDAASWAKLANVIDACSMRPEASELGELASAVEELEAARSGFEGAVSAELRRGRVARRAPVASVAVNAAELATRWSHEPISAAELLSAAAEHDAFPRPSAAGRALVSRARVAAALREATLSCDITRAASWSLLCSALDQAARQLPPDELALIEDYTDARDELADARTFTELNVTSALASHRSLKVGGEWSHADLSAKELVAAVAELEAYPRVSDDGRDLATKAKQVIAIRLALSKCDWASASTWGGIAAALDAVPPELATLDEISAARTELLEKRDSVVAAVRAELLRGASLRSAGAGGGWDHTGISTAALDAAAAEAAAFPRPAPEAARLLEEARAISSLRAALKDAKFGAALSWQPLAAFLAGHAALDELDEVRAAWQELREARDATTAVLTSAIANGCSRSVGAAKAWDHSALDAKSLHAAAVELDTFPRLTGAGDAKPAMIRRQSMIQRRQSLERVTEAADHLVASTKSVCRVRELLLGSSWAELHSLLTTLEAGPPLHELCAEEVRRASLELQDQLAMLEAAVRSSLDAHRSKRPTGGGAWDHSELSVDALQEAMVALRGFPLHGASTASLLKVGEFVVRVRKLLAASAWGELCSVLATTADSELMQNDEVRAAGIEVEEMRQQVVAHLSGAIELGRSLKIVGKKVNVFVDKSYFLPITWDHSGIADGIVKLRAAVGSVGAFPGVAEREGVGPMLELASLLLKLRQMIDKEDWAALGAALDAIVLPSHLTHDEVKMARQVCAQPPQAGSARPPAAWSVYGPGRPRRHPTNPLPLPRPSTAPFFARATDRLSCTGIPDKRARARHQEAGPARPQAGTRHGHVGGHAPGREASVPGARRLHRPARIHYQPAEADGERANRGGPGCRGAARADRQGARCHVGPVDEERHCAQRGRRWGARAGRRDAHAHVHAHARTRREPEAAVRRQEQVWDHQIERGGHPSQGGERRGGDGGRGGASGGEG